MSGSGRSSAGLDERRKRLLFRAWRRGTRELDLIFGPFADARIASLSPAELDMLEDLMKVPDPEVYGWLTGEAPVPPRYDRPVFRALAAFHEK
jgi:antitoxin CptB